METSKATQVTKKLPQHERLVLSAEEKKRLVDFFSLLIEIDQRNKKKSNETKDN